MTDSPFRNAPRSGKHWHQTIRPPHGLKSKVGSGGIDPGAFTRATSVMSQLDDSFPDQALEELDAMEADAAAAHSADINCEAVVSLRHRAFELRNGGGSFDFPLVTQIANSLHIFLEPIKDRISDAEAEVIDAHCEALRAVLVHRVRGDGGEMGRNLLDGLAKLVRKFTPTTDAKGHA